MTAANIPSPTTVLVVEDEMVLRMRAVDIVEDAGFVAVEAVSADQALLILEQRSDITMLFSDIQMPGTMDGLRLAHAVNERWPRIKIILVSGQITPTEAETPPDSKFFGKPLEVTQMISELQSMVGAGALKIVPELNEAAVDASIEQAGLIQLSHTEEALAAENDGLRLLLEQAGINARTLLRQAGIEAKEREASDNLQKLIMGELHHRIKNTLATVSAIAGQSLRTAPSMAHAQNAIEGRLAALGRAHDLLLQVHWANANLATTVRAATEPFDNQGAGRISIEGQDLSISSAAVISLAMTLNELCTNTTKFGALSVPAGRVAISWTVDEDAGSLNLKWMEAGGPTVNAPTRRSFGTRMMESLGNQLSGRVELSYHPSGFVYELVAPLSAFKAKGGPTS